MMNEDAAMTSKRASHALVPAILAVAAIGCASAPAEVRIQGIAVPRSWVERAESGDGSQDQAGACLALARKLWERDAIEALRYVRKGALLRDPACVRQYLAYAESSSVNLSQRVYARLFIERLLRQGPLADRPGEDTRGEFYYQLCWAWRFTVPSCPAKVKDVLRSMFEHGPSAHEESPFIARLIQETGIRRDSILRKTPAVREISLYAAEPAEARRDWLRVPITGERREGGEWMVSEANAWGGGSDRLLTSANVLAFLVNDQGEPSFRGTQLWICNLGDQPVYLTSLAIGESNRELPPGRQELLAPASQTSDNPALTTGISLIVRHIRPLR
jgi:hypothetical protein